LIQRIDQHYLTHNLTVRLPKRVLYLDVETKKQVFETEEHHRLKLAWTCYINKKKQAEKHREQWVYHDGTYGLCKYIESKTTDETPLYLFGHNIYFDLQSSDFFYFFTKWKWTLSFYYDKGLTYILVIKKGKKTLRILSTTNYFPTSLKKLGDMLGLEKQEVDFEKCSDEELNGYCRNDVEILKRIMEYYFTFIKDNDLGNFAMTRAGQALTAFRHRFMYKKIAVHKSPEIVEIERNAYFGGRVECFRFGEQPLDDYVMLDINSMYPYVMKNYPVPVRTLDIVKNPSLEIIPAILKNYGTVAEVVLKTEEPCYAVRMNQKVMFPVGEFETFVCTEGLKHAIENNHLIAVKQLVMYDMEIIFQAFVEEFFALRVHFKREKNELMQQACKYIMNSLYGKFGQKNTVEDRVFEPDGKAYYRIEAVDLDTHESFTEYKMFNTKVTQIGEKEGSKSLVSIPAHITEYSRFLLYSIIQQIGRDRVFYCDTDSVVCKKSDMDRLHYPINKQLLGALSIERSFRKFIINGPKHYVMGDTVKIKGVPKKAKKVGPYEYEYSEFMRSASHMRRNITRYYIIKTVPKVVEPFYDKGEVHGDGTVTPFRLGPSLQL